MITNGATATELLDVLARDTEPDESLVLDGTDLRTATLDSAREAVLVARHDATLFEGTLAENIDAGGLRDLIPVLVASGADEVRDTMPDGWTPRSASGDAPSPAASGSASPWLGPWPPTRSCWYYTT